MEQSIALMIQKFAVETPEKTALIVDGERCSYGTLALQNRKAAAYLRQQGIAPGDRIVVEADHTLAYVYLWYGIQLLGATFVPVELNTPSARITEIARELDAAKIVTLTAREDLPEAWALDQIMDQILELSDDFVPIAPDSDSLAEILFTTGTTGKRAH